MCDVLYPPQLLRYTCSYLRGRVVFALRSTPPTHSRSEGEAQGLLDRAIDKGKGVFGGNRPVD
jgi:hypothetical protein